MYPPDSQPDVTFRPFKVKLTKGKLIGHKKEKMLPIFPTPPRKALGYT